MKPLKNTPVRQEPSLHSGCLSLCIAQRAGSTPSYRANIAGMIAVGLVYLGLIVSFLGIVSLIKPPAFLRIRNRKQAALLVGLGVLSAIAGWALPAKEVRIVEPRTQLDQFAPVYQFNEVHSIQVAASREQVYRAIKDVTADEIRLFRTLTWLRRFGRDSAKSILNPPEHTPILEVAMRTGFLLLAEEPNQEIVVGTAVATPPGFRPKGRPTPERFKAVQQPGFVLATMNFLVEDAGPSVFTVTTETRVYATDAATRRRFAVYWRVIYPGSALIRRMWLQAIKRRAEASGS
jgi:hypothetical protein